MNWTNFNRLYNLLENLDDEKFDYFVGGGLDQDGCGCVESHAITTFGVEFIPGHGVTLEKFLDIEARYAEALRALATDTVNGAVLVEVV
jgi:hypothetical protein